MKKGFSLTEMLVVIAIVALISVIIVPSVIMINKKVNQRMLKTKKESIITAAELFAQDNPDIFQGTNTASVFVAELIRSDYLKVESSDDEKYIDCTSVVVTHDNSVSEEVFTNGCIINPINNSSMNGVKVFLRRDVSGVIASIDDESLTATPEKKFNDILTNVVCEHFDEGLLEGAAYKGEDVVRCGCAANRAKLVSATWNEETKKLVLTDDEVNACIVKGNTKNNYLRHDNRYYRVVGLYNLANSVPCQDNTYKTENPNVCALGNIVAKLITDEPVDFP